MIGQVRTARPEIILNGQDYYSALAPYFLTMEYSDNCDGAKADDLQIELADRDKRFISDWMPDKGAFLDVSIIAERWFSPTAPSVSLDCGRFWIDSVDFEIPQNTCSIKASSLPTDAHIKRNETRGWENSSLKDIAGQIAGENKMTVDYQSSTNPRYKRVEQNEESALAFLRKLANDAKLSIKIHRSSLVIFDEETYEAADPKFTVLYGSDALTGAVAGLPVYRLTGGHFSTKLTDTTKKARCKHTNPETGRVTDEIFSADDDDLLDEMDDNVSEDPGYEPDEDSGDGGGDGLRLHRPGIRLGSGEDGGLADWTLNDPGFNDGKGAGGAAAGQRKAKSMVRNANKDKETGTIDLDIGNPLVAAGMTFNLAGLGKYDGKWFVTSARHTLAPVFTTSLEIRRCLVGY